MKILLVLVLLFATPAFADAFEAKDELRDICKLVKIDAKGDLRKKMTRVRSAHSLKLNDYYGAITCGGKSLVEYADDNGSYKAMSLIVKRVNRATLRPLEYTHKLSPEGVSIVLARLN